MFKIKTLQSRYLEIDGLRGIAIILVLLFHIYDRYPRFLPYTCVHRDNFIFHNGYLGVELFFFISGFVITFSLENSISYFDFLKKRFLRLWPLMFVASILIHFTGYVLINSPYNNRHNLYDIIPGIIFISPQDINYIFNTDFDIIQASFWSIFVEVKFYIIYGFLYFYFRKYSIFMISFFFLVFATLLLLNIIGVDTNHIPTNTGINSLYLYNILISLVFNKLGWFAIGALIYKYKVTKNINYLLTAITLLPLSIIARDSMDRSGFIFTLILFILFFSANNNKFIANILSIKPLLYLGNISYAFYLIHENAVVALTTLVHKYFIWIPDMLTPLPAIMLLLIIASLMTNYVEKPIRNIIVKLLGLKIKIK